MLMAPITYNLHNNYVSECVHIEVILSLHSECCSQQGRGGGRNIVGFPFMYCMKPKLASLALC